jgi:hypothetical protein
MSDTSRLIADTLYRASGWTVGMPKIEALTVIEQGGRWLTYLTDDGQEKREGNDTFASKWFDTFEKARAFLFLEAAKQMSSHAEALHSAVKVARQLEQWQEDDLVRWMLYDDGRC